MAWYRAEIRGKGYYIDAGASLPEEKVVISIFKAASDEEAGIKASNFAKSPDIRKMFWMTDPDPKITITRFLVGYEPSDETMYLLEDALDSEE